ncbi:MAG: tRNA uridine-5-carboxymethylaminomethyl(34) synthesis GTPase MnmE, partial [Gammaproteobacteria bacterium]|nr:tRNA uridine-5-carboxymethylaminomethyl(34) synthesis GTPase MnmE [Gammaproteobacteria bacterium]
MHNETIAAIASASGQGGIGVVRISGPAALNIGQNISGFALKPRYAQFCDFKNAAGDTIDQGIALFFNAPHSFTGEDVVELQGHGNSFVLDDILQSAIALGARLAKPGEFSERAFLNNKIDLAQAEAIADIIASSNHAAARSAVASLAGEFSETINDLLASLTRLRVYVEATIDFPDEEIDLPGDTQLQKMLEGTQAQLHSVLAKAKQGRVIRDGLSLIIVGEPNTGKSSLLNRLAGEELAIVNQQAGTTRDMLREHIMLDSLPLKLIDTAGLRDSTDEIEQEGIRRAGREIERADIVFFLQDYSDTTIDPCPARSSIKQQLQQYNIKLGDNTLLVVVNNKIDLRDQPPARLDDANSSGATLQNYAAVAISARYDQGIDLLSTCIRQFFGLAQAAETTFTARLRHLDSLQHCRQQLDRAQQQIRAAGAAELIAEDL